MAVDIGQSKVPAGRSERQFFMIESEQLQNSGVQIVNMHGLFRGFKTKVIGGPMDISAPGAPARQPDRKPIMIMVATVDLPGIGAGRGQFHRRRPAEFSPPND